jgi:hypothetical protein
MDTQIGTELEQITARVPKVFGGRGHAVMDYVTAGTFLAAGFAMRRRNPAAGNCALANGVAILGVSMITDYPGGVWPLISFKTHGVIDALQAAMTAGTPAMLGFAGEPEGQFFHGQAALEAGVIAATDFNDR